MLTYLTSSFITYQKKENYRKAFGLNANGFMDELRRVWPKAAKLLFFASAPDDAQTTDFQAQELLDVLTLDGLSVEEMRIEDHRNAAPMQELTAWADVIYLAGGHAPTQLRFMREMRLKEALKGFDGILIGLSAGSVNAADEAYLMPELAGEAVDPQYERFCEGLGLTALKIIPHRDYIKDVVLDGKRYVEDILLPDSYGRRFYMIPDGGYFRIQDGVTEFFGEGELIENGQITPLRAGVLLPSSSAVGADIWTAAARDGYECLFTIDKQSGDCFFYHLGERAEDILKSRRYEDICRSISGILVEEEQEPFLEQSRIETVIGEVSERTSYVRTIHVDVHGRWRAKNMRINPIPGRSDKLLCSILDIATAIDHDWMTDEYARTGFMDRARLLLSELPKEERLSLIYTNVKGFKAVNELFGEQSGDMVIFQTRDALRRYLKPLLLGRLESDHFVLLVRDDALSEENLTALSRQTYVSEYKEYHFEIRCGIYHITDRETAVNQMIDRAKLAEKSIRDDRGAIYASFDEPVREKYVLQQMLLSDMKEALDAHEFLTFYQPIVDVKTGAIASAEALIRWRHHDLGMVSPGDFVPTFENAGKISALDVFMADSIIGLTSQRVAAGEPIVPCAVNLSRIDFYDPALMEHLRKRFAEWEQASRYVRLEVTESAYADLERNAMEYLTEMKRAGIKILLDDFGSGMSSLSTLETFEFDIVKLDMGFIRKIGISAKAETIIESTIKLSHALGAKVTAEGVETPEQVEFLKAADCDYIQGYYFYKPLPEAEFIEALKPDV